MKNPLDDYMGKGQQQALAAVGALVAVGVAIRRAGKASGSRQIEAPGAHEGEAPRRSTPKRRSASKVKATPKASPKPSPKKGAKVSAKQGASPKAKTSSSKAPQAKSEWTRFLSARVPQLVKQGYTAPQAMKQAASEFRAR